MTTLTSFTLQGHFLGRLTQITWTDGTLTGDPQVVDLVKRDAAGYEGHLVRSTTPGESTMTNHLSNPYVAATLMGRWFAEQQPEMIAGSLPEIGPLASDGQIFTDELDSIELYNPYHDARGRFASGGGATTTVRRGEGRTRRAEGGKRVKNREAQPGEKLKPVRSHNSFTQEELAKFPDQVKVGNSGRYYPDAFPHPLSERIPYLHAVYGDRQIGAALSIYSKGQLQEAARALGVNPGRTKASALSAVTSKLTNGRYTANFSPKGA